MRGEPSVTGPKRRCFGRILFDTNDHQIGMPVGLERLLIPWDEDDSLAGVRPGLSMHRSSSRTGDISSPPAILEAGELHAIEIPCLSSWAQWCDMQMATELQVVGASTVRCLSLGYRLIHLALVGCAFVSQQGRLNCGSEERRERFAARRWLAADSRRDSVADGCVHAWLWGG